MFLLLQVAMSELQVLASQKGFKIVHLNIRSLTSKIETLRIDLENSGIDMFTVSETWLSQNYDSSLVNINNYHLLRQDKRCEAIIK